MALILMQLLALIGVILSLYALKVEWIKKKIKNYNPVCNINEKISCTKAFMSKYNNVAGISNAWYGIFYYLIIIALGQYNLINYIFFLALFAFLSSIYLAYISYIKLKTFCLVCSSVYVINLLLLVISAVKL